MAADWPGSVYVGSGSGRVSTGYTKLVDCPLNTTEEILVGTESVPQALKRAFNFEAIGTAEAVPSRKSDPNRLRFSSRQCLQRRNGVGRSQRMFGGLRSGFDGGGKNLNRLPGEGRYVDGCGE